MPLKCIVMIKDEVSPLVDGAKANKHKPFSQVIQIDFTPKHYLEFSCTTLEVYVLDRL